MMWIKVLLIGSFLVLLVLLFRHRDRVLLRAGTRLVAIGLFIAAVVSIVDPDIPQRAAEFVGVSRGTDLLLYLLVVVFAMSTMGLYFRLREMENRVRKLARAIAISESIRREDNESTRREDEHHADHSADHRADHRADHPAEHHAQPSGAAGTQP
jgi:small membrane protein